MSASIATVLVAGIGVLSAIITAVVNAMFARGGQRADTASTLTKTGMELLLEARADCAACRTELGQVKRALRAIVRMQDHPEALQDAIDAAKELV